MKTVEDLMVLLNEQAPFGDNTAWGHMRIQVRTVLNLQMQEAELEIGQLKADRAGLLAQVGQLEQLLQGKPAYLELQAYEQWRLQTVGQWCRGWTNVPAGFFVNRDGFWKHTGWNSRCGWEFVYDVARFAGADGSAREMK